VVSDRFGRKVMFLRALYFGSVTGAVAAVVVDPWQIAIAFAVQGLFSGFIPAAIALVSVSVPDSRLTSTLGWVTGAQYIGTTVGPAVGALLAIVLDYRGAILVASVVPLVAGTLVLLRVPADMPGSGQASAGGAGKGQLEPFRPGYQFALAVLIYFVVFSLTQLVRLATPIALRGIEGSDDVAGVAGIAFSLAGLVGSLGVIFLAPATFKAGSLRTAFTLWGLVAAVGHVGLALAGSTFAFVTGFVVVGLVMSIMVPATNTLIAGNAPRSRRGTAFGIAGSAQAVSFMVGPAAAAIFAALSLEAGFMALGLVMVAMSLLTFLTLREPPLDYR
jgi:DHA1 family multidrug resistance protein-like MFS transporter